MTLRADPPGSEVTNGGSGQMPWASGPKDICRSTDHYDRVMADQKRAGFIAGGPRRARNEGEGFWTFLRDWIASLFRVDRRM